MLDRVWSEVVSPPTASCHASTLALLPGGLACAWFGGPFEGARETAIYLSERREGVWSAPERVADVEPMPHWNPVLHVEGEALQLYFKVGIYPKRWRTYLTTRALGGGAWRAPRELVPGDVGGRGPVKNKPLRVSSGALLAPASLEDDEGWRAFVDRSEDGGQTWERTAAVPLPADHAGNGIIQPALWESAPGRVSLLARSTSGFVIRSDSSDGGRTWSEGRATSVPNNNSGLDLTRLESGELLLACNPVGGSWGPRTPLSLLVSSDDGSSWEEALRLEEGEGEFSYPAVVSEGSRVFVSYTKHRRTIGACELAWSARNP